MADLVRQLIDYVYDETRYIGKIEAKELFTYLGYHRGWLVKIQLGSKEYPLEIAFDGSNSEFINYLEDRLHKDHLHDMLVFVGKRIRPDTYIPECNHGNKETMPKFSAPEHKSAKASFNDIMEVKDPEIITDWVGTLEEYNKILVKNPDINYFITE